MTVPFSLLNKGGRAARMEKIKTLVLVVFLFIAAAVYAQPSEIPVYKFDFGNGKAAKGYTKILPTDIYSDEKGYGFDLGTAPQAAKRHGKDKLKGDFVASDKPFYFSVKVPEGNYKIKVTLGDPNASSQTTVKAESRRLMLENLHTRPGETISKTFIVNIKDRNISDGRQVGLKQRELTKLDWDNKLTLEFDLNPALSSMEISRVEDQVTVFLAGNSTVVNQEEEPWASWGQMIPRFFKPGVAIANHAESGLSLGSFLSSRRLDKVLSVMKPGDYLFIEFGHNDEKEKGPEAGAYESYTKRLHHFITEAKKKGGRPVILTPTARRSFGQDGKMTNSHGDFPDAARQVAAAENIPLIDLTALTTTLYEALGVEGSKNAFVIYPEQGLNDNTHFNTYGAYQIARIVVQEIKNQNMELEKFLMDVPVFDPAHPDPFKAFSWPPSPKSSLVKPDGN